MQQKISSETIVYADQLADQFYAPLSRRCFSVLSKRSGYESRAWNKLDSAPSLLAELSMLPMLLVHLVPPAYTPSD